MMLLQTLLSFLLVLAILIVVHELGHYWVARLCNVKVLRFSVGMGKIVWSRRIGPDQTEWAISALPLGGYVKMLDAREGDLSGISPQDLEREFTRQSVWKRIAIVAAGPLANFLLAILIFFGLYSYGMPEPIPKLRAAPEQSVAYQAGLRGGELVTAVDGEPVAVWSEMRWKVLRSLIEGKAVQLDVQRSGQGSDDGVSRIVLPANSVSPDELEGDFLGKLGLDLARPQPILGRIMPDSPAGQAGLRTGDTILRIDGETVADSVAFVELIQASPGKSLIFEGVDEQGKTFSTTVIPQAQVIDDGRTIGRIQAEIQHVPEMAVVRAAPIAAFGSAVAKTWDTSALTLRMLGKMLVGEASLKNITGPITIADYAGQTARIGLISFLSFIAFVSISLGIMNLLPIPVLDGGHLMYYSVEVITGRPVSERFGEIAQRAGIGVLMVLMSVAVFNDIVRLLS